MSLRPCARRWARRRLVSRAPSATCGWPTTPFRMRRSSHLSGGRPKASLIAPNCGCWRWHDTARSIAGAARRPWSASSSPRACHSAWFRLHEVLVALYLMFNEGYLASDPEVAERPDLTRLDEARPADRQGWRVPGPSARVAEAGRHAPRPAPEQSRRRTRAEDERNRRPGARVGRVDRPLRQPV
jgi:hypothetical protein